jgi:hypothetical protein
MCGAYFQIIYVCFGKNCVMYGRMLIVQTTGTGYNCCSERSVRQQCGLGGFCLIFLVCLYFTVV